jgi:hypothetical protein
MTEDDPWEVITVSGRQTVHIHNLIPARGWWAVFEVDGSYSNTDRVVLWAVVDRGRGYEEVHGLVSAGKEGLVLAEEATPSTTRLPRSSNVASRRPSRPRLGTRNGRCRPRIPSSTGPERRPLSRGGRNPVHARR